MPIEGLDHIQRRIRDQGLVENLGARDLTMPEGCGVDLRLKAVYQIGDGSAFIATDRPTGLGMRQGSQVEQVLCLDPGIDEQAYLTSAPGDYYLVETIEVVHMPEDLMAHVYPRSSLYRSGLLLLASKADPGYHGPFILGLANVGPCTVRLQLGARICTVVFQQIVGATAAYRGQYQGGRITATDPEIQV